MSVYCNNLNCNDLNLKNLQSDQIFGSGQSFFQYFLNHGYDVSKTKKFALSNDIL